MNKVKTNLFVVLILSFALLVAGCSSSGGGVDSTPTDNTANLTVEVQDVADGTSIDGASVTVKSITDSTMNETTNGEAVFNSLEPSTYEVSVVKNGYIASTGTEIQLKEGSNKTKAIKLAQETTTDTISTSSETTEVGNSLVEMDVSSVASDLEGSTVTTSGSDKSVKDLAKESGTTSIIEDTEEVVGSSYKFSISNLTSSNVSANIAAATTGTSAEFTNYVQIKVDMSNFAENPNDLEGKEYGLAVAVSNSNGTGFTKGQNLVIENGKLKVDIPLKYNNAWAQSITLSITVKKSTEQIQDTTVEDAKTFVTNLRDHGVNLKEAGQKQANKIEANFKQEVIPYTVAIGYRMDKVEQVMGAWEELADLADESVYENDEYVPGYGPGDYTINLAALDKFQQMRWSWPGDYFSDYNDYRDEFYADTSYTAEEYTSGKYAAYQKYYFENYTQYNSFIDYIEEQTNFIVSKNIIDDPQGVSDWQWNIDFKNSAEHVTIKVKNPAEVETENEQRDVMIDEKQYDWYLKETFDYTKLDFSYHHTSDSDSKLDWSLDFTIDAQTTETVEGTLWEYEYQDSSEEDGIYREREDYKYIMPREATYKIVGTMTDNQNYTDKKEIYDELYQDGVYDTQDEVPTEIPAIGNITIDGSLSMDAVNNDKITYQGMFSAEEFSYNGSTTFEFSNIPSYQDMHDDKAEPVISAMNFSGKFSTDAFKIDGSTEIDFVNKDITNEDGENETIPLPDMIRFDGLYQDVSVDQGFTLNGSLNINPDYTNFDVDLTSTDHESANNYLPGNVILNGQLTNTGFEDVRLVIEVARTGYQKVVSDFRYEFGGNKFIEGEATNEVINGTQQFDLVAFNEQDLKINMDAYDGADQEKIGEITSYDGSELYGEIVISDSQPVVNIDGEIISLVPTQQ